MNPVKTRGDWIEIIKWLKRDGYSNVVDYVEHLHKDLAELARKYDAVTYILKEKLKKEK